MNIDDMKATWAAYDAKLQHTQTLNQKLINSMISERSRSRVAGIQREFALVSVLALCWLVVIIAVLVGNPFDYNRSIEYAPVIILALSFVSILLIAGKISLALSRVDIGQNTVAAAIKEVIKVYNQPSRLLKLTVKAMFSAGLMFPLSFLPRKIEKAGLGAAMIDTAIPMVISILLYWVAVQLGLFRQRHIEGLKSDLDELADLKALSNQLAEG